MIHLLAIALATLVASTSFAATYSPCSPVFIAGPQGRPIPNNTVLITTLAGGTPATGVWNDSNGAVAFGNVLPPNQILQVFMDPGIYRVTVSGDGLTKQYQITCGEGYGGDAKKISIDRTADVMQAAPAPAANLFCPGTGLPCVMEFAKAEKQYATFDFIMPSFPLSLSEFRLSWKSTTGVVTGTVEWEVDYCVYTPNTTPCVPSGANTVSVVGTAPTGNTRIDTILGENWSWAINEHVVVKIARPVGGTLNGTARLENVRLEFTRL